ncbi:MAG: response regulator, partial [Myxococcales bacterium]|nr:response regulator [Myxococcales bacterium]
SKPGAGTVFVILLPTTGKSSSTMQAVQPSSEGPRPAETGTILLVEDDAGLRRAALRTLSSKGYRVLEARDGLEALATFAEHEGIIDLVVTDVVMPRMTGPKLIAELRSRGIKVKAIYCSGYTFDMLDPRALDDGSFLSKPFSPEDLLNAVRTALAS